MSGYERTITHLRQVVDDALDALEKIGIGSEPTLTPPSEEPAQIRTKEAVKPVAKKMRANDKFTKELRGNLKKAQDALSEALQE